MNISVLEAAASMAAESFEDLDPRFYELIGRISADWAWLEMMLSDCLWALSGAPWGAGACVTSQIYTFDAKMKALIALLELKSVDQQFVKKVMKFHEKSRKAQGIRNRAIHDVWGHDNGLPVAFVITTQKKLRAELNPKTIDGVLSDLGTIEDAVLEFEAIRSTLRGFLMTLPDTRPLALQATFQPHARK